MTDCVQLLVEFLTSDEIQLSGFIDTEFSGYVFVRIVDELIKIGKSDKYKIVRATGRYDYTTTKIKDEDVGYDTDQRQY